MTDGNIMKALECCTDVDCLKCSDCPYHDHTECICDMSKDAFELINRQKDQIESLTVGQETLQQYVVQLTKELERADVRSSGNDR